MPPFPLLIDPVLKLTSALTELLLAQRANHTILAQLPADLVPANAAQAYVVQDETVAALGGAGAWKVAPMPAEGEPFCSPILASDIHASGTALRKADLPGLGIEVEVAVTLGEDLGGKPGGYTPEDILAAIASWHVAIEVLASRYADRTTAPTLAAIADLQSSGAVILGPPTQFATLPEFGAQALVLRFDGEVVQQSAGNATTENVLASLAWLANHAAGRGQPLRAGYVVITGARLGPLSLPGKDVVAEAPGLGTVSASFA